MGWHNFQEKFGLGDRRTGGGANREKVV